MKNHALLGLLAAFLVASAGGLLLWQFVPRDYLAQDKDLENVPHAEGEQVEPGRVLAGKSQSEPAAPPRQPASPSPAATLPDSWEREPGLHGRYPARLTGINYRSDMANTNLEAASRDFLDKYAAAFPVNQEQLKVEQILPRSEGKGLQKVIYSQEIEGVPVYGSRMAFFYLQDGTLFEVQANFVPEDEPVITTPQISAIDAASIAYRAIERRYARAGEPVPDRLSPAELAATAKFYVFLEQTGSTNNIYQFVVELDDIEGTAPGQYEIAVDTAAEQIVLERRVSRN